MRQANINNQMAPWSTEEMVRYQRRAWLFESRGLTEAGASFVADRLALRDQRGDDRRICIECKQWRTTRCAARQPFVNDVLQRCPAFIVEVPAK
jgi:hypothetical protein